MLDLKYVLDHPDEIKANCRNRNVSEQVIGLVDIIRDAAGERKTLLQTVEDVRRQQNEVAQATGERKTPPSGRS